MKSICIDGLVKLRKEPCCINNTLVDLFFEQKSLPRYAIGKNEDTLSLSRIVALDGIIDDYSPQGNTWYGMPLLKTKDVPLDALIANCSTSISPVSVLDHLSSHGFKNVVGLNELIASANEVLEWPEFVKFQRSEITEYYDDWLRIYEALVDDESRQTFYDVIAYRLTLDARFMRGYSVRIDEQYFEEFMGYEQEVFVDAGGFDGDTSESFADRYNDYKKILFFEPSKKNMLAARQRLKKRERIEFYELGLSDVSGVLHFNQDAGSASSITADGSLSIDVDSLDSVVKEKVSFIKMDLEGWELNALKGAEGHIRSDHPKLAIAVYHNSSDFRKVFQFIKGFGLDYQVYLRHYTQGWSETIMYFLPRKLV